MAPLCGWTCHESTEGFQQVALFAIETVKFLCSRASCLTNAVINFVSWIGASALFVGFRLQRFCALELLASHPRYKIWGRDRRISVQTVLARDAHRIR